MDLLRQSLNQRTVEAATQKEEIVSGPYRFAIIVVACGKSDFWVV